jgi:glutamate 5-kinase
MIMALKRVIIKLGTSALTAGGQSISLPHLLDFIKEAAWLHQAGFEVVLISSGAVAAGKDALKQPTLDKHIPAKQMLAAIGQSHLMEIYNQLFQMYGITVAQVLLTRDDLLSRNRYLNARNTLEALIEYRVIPIINENDTVATEEIRFGDNDNLSAQVANLVEADLLVLMTDQDGLYTSDPRTNPEARLIELIDTPEIPEELFQGAGSSNSGLGTGGMQTKLKAAELARHSGAMVYIVSGQDPAILRQIVYGETVGTRFLPIISTLENRKRFLLAHATSSSGFIKVDSGAAAALRKGGSLLPVGIRETSGTFDRGDIVRVDTVKGKPVVVGIANYSSNEIQLIAGQRSSQIENTLGYTYGDEVIHHNNMVVLNHE